MRRRQPWPVDDEATVHLTTSLYGALDETGDTAGALRAAMLAIIADGATPREWAGFVLVE